MKVPFRLGRHLKNLLELDYVADWAPQVLGEPLSTENITFIYSVLKETLNTYDRILDEYVARVKVWARDELGIAVGVERRHCDAPRCKTCMGRYPLHYPRWYRCDGHGHREIIHESGGVAAEFIRQALGDEVRDLYFVKHARAYLLQFMNWFAIYLNKLGLTDELPAIRSIGVE
ncbi:MAG: hypothetical protein ACE5Z5_08065 [Candidatus Bathyarchaeia archaeon]